MTARLNVWSLLYYLTETDGLTWRQDDYIAKKVVDAAKGKPIKGYFVLPITGKETRFDQNNIQQFLPILFNTLAIQLKTAAAPPFDIIPVPNSDAVVGSETEFATLKHAREIARFAGNGIQAVPALRWKQPKKRAHEGGGRDPDVHFENLSVVVRPTQPCVIYDDVTTSGSQMIACSRRLAEVSCMPVLGIVVGRAVKIQKTPPIGWQMEPLDVDKKIFDSDF